MVSSQESVDNDICERPRVGVLGVLVPEVAITPIIVVRVHCNFVSACVAFASAVCVVNFDSHATLIWQST